jgi:hypothetical protein
MSPYSMDLRRLLGESAGSAAAENRRGERRGNNTVFKAPAFAGQEDRLRALEAARPDQTSAAIRDAMQNSARAHTVSAGLRLEELSAPAVVDGIALDNLAVPQAARGSRRDGSGPICVGDVTRRPLRRLATRGGRLNRRFMVSRSTRERRRRRADAERIAVVNLFARRLRETRRTRSELRTRWTTSRESRAGRRKGGAIKKARAAAGSGPSRALRKRLDWCLSKHNMSYQTLLKCLTNMACGRPVRQRGPRIAAAAWTTWNPRRCPGSRRLRGRSSEPRKVLSMAEGRNQLP